MHRAFAGGHEPGRIRRAPGSPAPGKFAKNDIGFEDPVGADHDALGKALNKALYSYMHGIGARNFIERAGAARSAPKRPRLSTCGRWTPLPCSKMAGRSQSAGFPSLHRLQLACAAAPIPPGSTRCGGRWRLDLACRLHAVLMIDYEVGRAAPAS